jgi:hypothetical protein
MTGCTTKQSEAAEQRDAADEGRLEAVGSTIVGTVIVNRGKVVRPSQLIASVRQTIEEGRKRRTRRPPAGERDGRPR